MNFVNDLAPGDSIVGATWIVTVSQGVDPNPSARLVNTPWLVNPTTTSQLITGGIPGVSYCIQVVCPTAFGMTISLVTHSRCEVVS
jgi:hypothetical protein